MTQNLSWLTAVKRGWTSRISTVPVTHPRFSRRSVSPGDNVISLLGTASELFRQFIPCRPSGLLYFWMPRPTFAEGEYLLCSKSVGKYLPN